MDSLDLNCTICEEEYKTDRIPRNINCGHSFCTECLDQILGLDKKCPECRKPICGRRAVELPVNYTVLRLANSLASLQVKKEVPTSASSASEVNKKGGSCKAEITIKEMKSSYKLSVNFTKYHNKAKLMKEVLDNESTFLQLEKNEVKEALRKLQSKEEELATRVSHLREVKDMMERSEAFLNQAATTEELESAKTIMACSHDAINDLESVWMENSRQALVSLLKEGKTVYAIFEDSGKKRWSSVSIRDNQILLYSLRDGNPPTNGLMIPFGWIREMVPGDSPSIFMEVSWDGQFRGRVYVKMFGNTPRSCQTTFLCSGERGPSYRGTVFYKYYQAYEGQLNVLSGGDYEHNNGSGGRAIVEGITDSMACAYETVSGLMVSWSPSEVWHLGSFEFFLNSLPGEYDYSAHGMVTNGLEILVEAAKVKPISNAAVTDCGLIIPL